MTQTSCSSRLDTLVDSQHGQQTDVSRQALELEISRVEAQMELLVQKHKLLKKALNDRFTPALQLPPEISTEIFMHCLRVPNKELTTPFQLGHICQTWRDFVWSTPRLWSILLLDTMRRANIKLIKEWLVRSGRQPLFISLALEYGQKPCGKYINRYEDIIKVLTCFSDRWHTICFCITMALRHCKLSRVIKDALQKPLPLLTSASFCNLVAWDDVLRSAPQLDEIHLLSCDMPKYSFLSPKITRVSLTGVPIDDCLTLLANTPSLKHCTLTSISELSGTASKSITHTCLESLTINREDEGDLVADMLDCLTTPRLRNLAINSHFSPFPFSSVVSLTTRSSCTLQCLSLSGPGIQPEGSNLLEFLRVMTPVVELNLSSRTVRRKGFFLLLVPSYPHPSGHAFVY